MTLALISYVNSNALSTSSLIIIDVSPHFTHLNTVVVCNELERYYSLLSFITLHKIYMLLIVFIRFVSYIHSQLS
jgi:hypothetical protein